MDTNDTQETAAAGGEPRPDAVATSGASVHETLLEGVSTDAIVARGFGEPAAASDSDSAATDIAPEQPPLADDLTVVPEEATEVVPLATEIVEATVAPIAALPDAIADAGPETVAANTIVSASGTGLAPALPIAAPDLRTVLDFAASPRIAQAMGELGEVNATVLTYLRGEGSAALAHWQALSGAKTPADAIRIQVDELQRAADASLSCFAALAKRASRFTSAIGRT